MRTWRGIGAVAVLLGPLVLAVPAQAADGPRVEVLAEGLNSPRGIAVADDGTVYVAESGVGGDAYCLEDVNPETGEPAEVCFGPSAGITMIAPDGTVTRQAVPDLASYEVEGTAFGASDVDIAPDGSLYITMGFGGPSARRDAVVPEWAPAATFGTLQHWDGSTLTTVFDLAAWEAENDPNAGQPSTDGEDGEPSDDSNADAVLVHDGSVFVADAGGNYVLEVDPSTEEAAMVAFLEDRMVDVPEMFGAPPGTQMPMQAVPTSLTLDPDGNVEIGQLTGFPFPVGGARVHEVDGDTTPAVAAEGFTNIMDLGYRDGELWTLEIAHHSLLDAEAGGALVRTRTDGSRIALLRDVLAMPGGMDVGPDGMIYITNGSVFPGGGSVIRFDPSQAADPATQMACPPDEVMGASFPDTVDTVHEESIVCLAWWELFAGGSDGMFHPASPISRGQFATVIARMVEAAGGDLTQTDDAFSDDDGTTHEEAIDKLAAADILGGFADGTFRPAEPVQRGQAATILAKAYMYVSETPLDDSGDDFTDDDSSPHRTMIQAAANAGWVNGVTATEYGPTRSITRAQVSSVLARMASTLVAEGALVTPS